MLQLQFNMRRELRLAGATLLLAMATLPPWLHAKDPTQATPAQPTVSKGEYYQCIVHRPEALGRTFTKHYRFPLTGHGAEPGFNGNLRWSRFTVRMQGQERIQFEVAESFPQGGVKQAIVENLPSTWKTDPFTMTLSLTAGELSVPYALICGPETVQLRLPS